MSYTLIGSHTSPFVRKLRMIMNAKGLVYDFKSVNYLEKNDSDYLKSINPLNQLPMLFDGQEKVFHSRVIYNYLSRKHQWPALTLQEENILSAIDTGLETSVNLFSFRRGGLNLDIEGNYFVDRQKERPFLILSYLQPWMESLDPQNPRDWNFLSMSLYAYLFWAQFRQILDLSSQPAALAFLEKFKNHPGVKETDIPA